MPPTLVSPTTEERYKGLSRISHAFGHARWKALDLLWGNGESILRVAISGLEGSKLGDLPRGKLFPKLDAALFQLKAGEVSGAIESELGFHVLRCDTISEASVLGFAQAKQHIRKLLEQKRKRACQQAWMKQLLNDESHTK